MGLNENDLNTLSKSAQEATMYFNIGSAFVYDFFVSVESCATCCRIDMGAACGTEEIDCTTKKHLY